MTSFPATVPARDGRDGVEDAFLALPHAIRAADPLWIPEEPTSVARAFSDANPWFHGREAATFCIPDRGRAAVFRDPAVAIDGAAAAYLGFWESAGDDDADRAILDAAERWAAGRGAALLVGPVNFGTYGDYRFRVAPFDGEPPFPGEPQNPPEYPARFERLGFAPLASYVTQIGGPPLGAVDAKRAARDALVREGFRFDPLTPDLWLGRHAEFHALVNGAFASNPGFAPIEMPLFAAVCGESYIARACPHSSVAAIAPDGSVAGFFLLFPHYGEIAVQGAGADRVKVSELRHDRHAERARIAGRTAAVAKTVAVAPQWRRSGMMNALATTLIERGAPRYARWYGALIRADNASRRYSMVEAERERGYALYTRRIAA